MVDDGSGPKSGTGRALLLTAFGGPLDLIETPEPACPDHAAVIEVRATGVCRSDWHAWRGHDTTVTLPHVPGHEFAGVVRRVGPAVRDWRPGRRVTAPFVNACGTCPTCRAGRWSVCPRQTQPGFDRWGSWADRVVVHNADVNLVALPDALDDVTAAALGCRFATAYRAVSSLAAVTEGESLLVLGCGGVGLAAVMIGAARGARVIAVDRSAGALTRAAALGADTVLQAAAVTAERIVDLTGGGASASVDALGSPDLVDLALRSLRPGGRHVQIGLLADPRPPVDLGRVIAGELRLLGSHGMAAADYPPLLAEIAAGVLDPQALVGRSVPLAAAGEVLAAMSGPDQAPGTTVLVT